MGALVRLSLLGGFELVLDETSIGPADFERRSGAELIQLLALADGHRLHREQVMDALWPGATMESAANSLRKAATFARRATGASDTIVVRGQIVALFPDRKVEIDVEVVEAARADDDESVTAAVEAYRGGLLPDTPYADWAIEARDRLQRSMVALLTASHRWDELLAVDPANEEAVVAVMDRALAGGDRQTVLRHYDELEARLRDELGVTPGRAAVMLRDRALELDRSASGGAAGSTAGGPRGMRTFLMTAIDGANRAEPAAPEATAAAVALLDHLVGEAVRDGGGATLNDRNQNNHDRAGDPDSPGQKGVGAVFGSASAAVAAAVAILRAGQAASWAGERPQIRIGLDVGEAEHRSGVWTGAVLERTAHIRDAAKGDQIVCSRLVADLAAPGLDPEITTVDLGLFRLPDQAPAVLHRVDAAGIEARPGLRAARLSGRPIGPSREVLIGRGEESGDVRRLLAAERLLTIVGPGGAGKTHLARHVASSAIDDFPGGVWMCRFGVIDDPRAVGQEVLTAIGAVQHSDATVIESIVRTLGQRHTLIVLDNCEHLLEPIASLSQEVLDRCPGVTFLATSREPLGLGTEQQYPLGQLSRAAAIELFLTGTRRQGATLDPAEDAVARICRRLDDLPLAVLLAAARTRTLDLATIESLLDDRFSFLSSAAADRPDHHQTLGTAIAWSFDGLSPELHQLLCDLSVFTGRFTLDEARAIGGGAGVPTVAIVHGLDVLIRRSLVTGPERFDDRDGGDRDGETTYRLLESIRLFARDRAARDHTASNAASDRHLTYFRDTAEANRQRQSDDSLSALRWFRSRWNDLRQAQAHAAANGRFDDLCRIVNAISTHCRNTGQLEMVEWCEHAIDPTRAATGPHHVEALANWASLSVHQGRVERAEALVANASACSAASDEPDRAEILLAGMLIAWSKGDHPTAARRVDQILATPDLEPSIEAGALMFKSIVASGTGGDVAPVADRLRALAAGRGPVFEAQDLFVRAVAASRTDPVAAKGRLDECQFLTDRHDLMDIGAAVRLIRTWVVPGVANGPLDILDVAADHIDWLQARGLWSYALVQFGISAPALAQIDRADLAVTLLSACEANGFTPSFRPDLIEALLVEAEAADGAAYTGWWEAGQRLDASAACSLALGELEHLLGRAPAPTG